MKHLALSLVGALLATLTTHHGVSAQLHLPHDTYTCPAPGLTVTPIPSNCTVTIPIITDPTQLCTLVRRGLDGTHRAPVARSYAHISSDRSEWEVTAGLYSHSNSGVGIDCSAATSLGQYTCDVTLPLLEEGEEYVLETFTRTLSPEATAARFLEQATFGATRSTIDALVDSDLDYEMWLNEQMYEIPASSLREYYRKRTNPKYEFGYYVGSVGSGPCELYSRWRTYAVSSHLCRGLCLFLCLNM